MGFFSEKIAKIGINPRDISCGYTITIFQGIGVIIEGKIRIAEYSTALITMNASKGKIKIIGQDLKVAYINSTEVYIKGRVSGYEFVE